VILPLEVRLEPVAQDVVEQRRVEQHPRAGADERALRLKPYELAATARLLNPLLLLLLPYKAGSSHSHGKPPTPTTRGGDPHPISQLIREEKGRNGTGGGGSERRRAYQRGGRGRGRLLALGRRWSHGRGGRWEERETEVGKAIQIQAGIVGVACEDVFFQPHPDEMASPCNLTGLGPLIFRIEAE